MNLKILFFLPDVLLLLTALYLLVTNLYKSLKDNDATTEPFLSKIGFYGFCFLGLLSLFFGWFYCCGSGSFTGYCFAQDKLAVGAKFVIFILGVPWLGLGTRSVRRFFSRERMRSFEYPTLLLFSMTGSFLLLSSAHLGLVFLGLSLQVLPLVISRCLYEDKTSGFLWSMRYLIFEIVSLAFLIFGLALIYGSLGDLDMRSLTRASQDLMATGATSDPKLLIGFLMVVAVFLFHLAAFPFHFWSKGFYESSSNLTVPFMVVLSFSLFVGLIRILFQGFYGFQEVWKPLLFYVGIGSSLWGAIGALFQTKIRSFFSCNYMFHLGMVLLGLSSGAMDGVEAALLYWFVYTLSACAFFFFWSNLSVNDQMLDSVEQAQGLGLKHPAFTLLIALTLLSLASLPPFAGFWCKLYILKSLISVGWGYVGLLLVFTIIASFQYFHIIRSIYFTERDVEIHCGYDWKTIWTFVPVILTLFFFFQDRIFLFLQNGMKGFLGD